MIVRQRTFFVAASPYNFKYLPDLTLKIGDVSIKPSETIRNLGAFFDVHMNEYVLHTLIVLVAL